MRKKITLLALLQLSILVGQQTGIPTENELRIIISESNIPSLGLGIIENGKISHSQVIGHLKDSLKAPNNAIFDTASITKSITTWLTLRLVDKGLFDLDEPLFTYWVDPDVADDPYHKLLTARHVLGHKSGFKNWRYMNEDGKLSFDFKPGSKVQYSGEGFEYLREALTRKFDTSFSELVRTWVFDPIKMKDSHVVWDDSIEMSRLTIAHDAEGNPYEFDVEARRTASAADDFLTTVDDLCRFGLGVMGKEGLSEEVFRQMIAPKSAVRDGVAFGLGWIVFENLSNGEYALLSAGSDKGVNAIILLLPESKRGLVALTNGDNGRKVVMQMIAKTIDVGSEILGRF
ncbi:MAG: serine hydrolase domain-containing protein [Bacteroidota bacterium]